MKERMNKKEEVNFISKRELVSEIVKKEKEEYFYIRSTGVEYEYIGFWMRMFGEHFRPCQKCQLEILRIFKHSQLDFTMDTMHVTFHKRFTTENKKSAYYEFGLPFILETINHWKPCEKCQKEVAEIVQTVKSLHIGNKEYVYPVEIYKEYDIDDKAWRQVERRHATKEEIQNPNLRID